MSIINLFESLSWVTLHLSPIYTSDSAVQFRIAIFEVCLAVSTSESSFDCDLEVEAR